MIHIIFGPSGSGKTEFCKKIRELRQQGENISIHCKRTTRNKRGYDEEEIESLNESQFKNWCNSNAAYVYARDNETKKQYFFGISKLEIQNAISNKEHHFIICNDIEIAKRIRTDFHHVKVRLLYLLYNAPAATIKRQIKDKLKLEKQNEMSISTQEVTSRYNRILKLNKMFEAHKVEFDGIIFNQYAPASLQSEVLNDLKRQIYNEIHFTDVMPSIVKNSVFVITPMGAINRDDYGADYPNDPNFFNKTKEIIQNTCASRGLFCVNFRNKSGENIINEIHDQISSAEYIIFDISANRPNCYYEYGLVKNLNKKIILLCNETTQTIKFDLSPLRYIKYNLRNLAQRLNDAFEDFIVCSKTRYNI